MNPFRSPSDAIVEIVATTAAAIGCLVLAGWQFDIVVFKSIVPGLPVMVPFTAALAIASALALALRSAAPRPMQHVGAAAAWVVVIAAGFVIREYLFVSRVDWPRWIGAAGSMKAGDVSGLPPPNTALAFLCLGVAILRLRAADRTAQVAAAIAAAIASVALAGNAYRAEYLVGMSRYAGMAVHTSIVVLLLSAGAAASQPRRGFMLLMTDDGAAGVLARRILPSCLVGVVVFSIVRHIGERAGWFDEAFGLALVVVATGGLLATVVWHAAAKLRGLERQQRDAERSHVQQREELVRSEALRRDTERTLELLSEHVHVLELAHAVVTDLDDRIVGWTEGAQRLYGWTLEEAIGQLSHELLRTEFPRSIDEVLRDLHENGRWEGELVQVAKDGRKLHVASHWVIRRDENIQPTAILEVNNDISSLRVVEQQRDDLLVRERRARAAAERASRLKDEFLATVSHELRTPLNAVLGWTKILLHRSSEGPDRRRALETIARNAQKQAQLVDDLLDVSRIVSGKLRLEPAIVDLGAIVRDAAEAVTPAIWRKGISLRIDVPPEGCHLTGDPHRLQQVVSNLLSNAAKFTEEGGSIEVTLREAGATTEICVRDSGIGITPEFLPYVFERFLQADGSTTRAYGGLGLGLAIVRHLVELHGGTVRAESLGEGHGALFTVALPRTVDAPAHDAGVTLPPARTPSMHPVSLHGVKVLIVDDDPDTVEVMAAGLRLADVRVQVAHSAAAAFELLATFKPDALLVDLAMPGESGIHFIKRVRQAGSSDIAYIPAAAVTALSRSTDRAQALAAGFQLFVAKPVDADTLVEAVTTLTASHPLGLRQV